MSRLQLTQAMRRKQVSAGGKGAGGALEYKAAEEGDLDAATATKRRSSIL
jgi:hypothetical protein